MTSSPSRTSATTLVTSGLKKNYDSNLKKEKNRPKKLVFHPKNVPFKRQFCVLFRRNIKLKIRGKMRTLMEIVFPLFIFGNVVFYNPTFEILKTTFYPKKQAELYYPPKIWEIFPNHWVIIDNVFYNQTLLDQFIEILDNTRRISFTGPVNFDTNFRNHSDFDRYYIRQTFNQERFVVLSLDSMNRGPTITYTIRLERGAVPNSPYGDHGECGHTKLSDSNASQCEAFKYYANGFNTIQAIVDTSILKLIFKKHGSFVPNFRIGVFPQPRIITIDQGTISLIITMVSYSFMPFFSMTPIFLVIEKEKKIKSAMFLMGLRFRPYWVAWLATQFLVSLVPCIFMAIIFSALKLTANLNGFLLYILIQQYAISLIVIGFMISLPFSSAKMASIMGSGIGILVPWMYNIVQFVGVVSFSTQRKLSLISPLAFAYTLKHSLFSTRPIPWYSLDQFSFMFGWIMLVIDTLIYFTIVLLGDVFLTHKSCFWPPSFVGSRGKVQKPNVENLIPADNEPVDDELKQKNVIQIVDVTKVFDKNPIINGITMDIYESQITALLGQNGAGKTTLINMITGWLRPTTGYISICGYRTDHYYSLSKLRTRFGVCFQEDILFDDLTTIEHLKFFAGIKGAHGSKMRKEIEFLLEETDLMDRKDFPVAKLSGGQKRKLCTAIALIGGSQIIFLDEPTSGVDAYSRQKIWSVLHSYKKNRVIILTTHMMYEADILADRKAILVKGKIRCIGSSMFLKNKFGIGYHLRLEIDPKRVDTNKLEHIVTETVANSMLERKAKSEILFTLPKNETGAFPKLFRKIDRMIENKEGILGYGVKLTTLEDVFLKITYENDERIANLLKGQSDSAVDFSFLNRLSYNPSHFRICWEFFKIRQRLIARNITYLFVLCSRGLSILYVLNLASRVQINMAPFVPLTKSFYSKMDSSIVFADNSPKSDKVEKMILELEKFMKPVQVPRLTLNTLHERHFAFQIDPIGSQPSLGKDPQIGNIELTMFFNKTFFHSLPILQGVLTNVLILSGQIAPFGPKDFSLEIRTNSWPLPEKSSPLDLMGIVVFIFIFGMLFISFPMNLCMETATERFEFIRTFLTLNGMRSIHYWAVTLIIHSLLFVVYIGLMLFVFFVVSPPAFLRTSDSRYCFLIMLILYIPTSLIYSYCISLFIKKKETMHGLMTNISSGIAFGLIIMAVVGLFLFQSDILIPICYFLWPYYVPYGCLLSIIRMEQLSDNTSGLLNINQDNSKPRSFYSWEANILPAYLALVFHFFVGLYFLIRWDKMNRNYRKPLDTPDEDTEADWLVESDIHDEKRRVKETINSDRKKPLLVIKNLIKSYPTNTVLNGIDLILETGQIFGLLGPNGAGKTTLMKIITREEIETSGEIYLDGKRLQGQPSDVIGYCPQINPLWQNITLMEHLRLFATIRGVPGRQIQPICEQFCKSFDMEQHKNKRFRILSGGTKRKVILLISILGNIKLTLLDEPSTGMDPNSKRLMWNILIKKFHPKSRCSAMMTTHSVEEIEALCSKIAIMAHGTFACLGSIQHLNNKYGRGYFLEIKHQSDFHFNEVILDKILAMFPNMKITDQGINRININVPQSDVKSLADFFEIMEQLKKDYPQIEEYSLAQSSIEQVFIGFAKLHAAR